MTHDGVFTKDNPVLPKQSTELAKEQADHGDTQTRESPYISGMRTSSHSILRSRLPSKLNNSLAGMMNGHAAQQVGTSCDVAAAVGCPGPAVD